MYVCFKPSQSNGSTTKYRFNQHHFLCTTHQQQAAHLKNTDTVTPPCGHQLPAVSFLMVSVIALRPMVVCDLHNKATKFVYIKLTHYLFYLHFSCFPLTGMLASKNMFLYRINMFHYHLLHQINGY